MPKQHAVLVTLVRLKAAKVFAKLAQVVFIKTTYVKQNVLNVHRENCTSMPKQHAVLVTLVHLKAVKVFAKIVRPGSIKIPKVKKSAVILAPHQKKYPTAKVPGANCHRGVPAKWANIYTTPTKTTTRGNVLPVPTVRIAQQSILLRHPPINADITHPDQKAGPRDTSTAFTYTPGQCVNVCTYP